MKLIRDLIEIIRTKSLKEIFFGNKVSLDTKKLKLLLSIKNNLQKFHKKGGRNGKFIKKDFIHKGKGDVYILPWKKILLFDANVKIQPGPDLYVYLSKKEVPSDTINLGLLKGTKGGQYYDLPKRNLQEYKYVIIYCKKFEVLFTYAKLK